MATSTTNEETDPYDLLGVTQESPEADIRKSYRQKSLKVHPDRNPDNPDAARLFHELNQAYELLLDPLRRLALDATLRTKAARKARFSTFDNKRKAFQSELDEAERRAKKQKDDKRENEMQRWRDNERVMEEGRRMREEMQKEAEHKASEVHQELGGDGISTEDVPSIGSLDTTVRLKYSLSDHPSLTAPEALASFLSSFGPTDESSIVLSMKPPKKAPNKPPKSVTAMAPFKQIGDAFAAVCATGRQNVEIKWAEGTEPPIIAWLKARGKLGAKHMASEQSIGSSTAPSTTPPERPFDRAESLFSSFPDMAPMDKLASGFSAASVPGLDYESLTLMRMRQAERERLEREILEQEANE